MTLNSDSAQQRTAFRRRRVVLALVSAAFLLGLTLGGIGQPMINAAMHPDLTIDAIRAGGFAIALHAESNSIRYLPASLK